MSDISIAMATFNGARFIDKQLQSLAAQTYLPAQLVIADDGSQDETLAKVAEFRASAPFSISIHQNRTRLGYRSNFMAAADRCTSPLIAFCDQDDVWRPDKLQRVRSAFNHPEVMLVQHNARVVNAFGEYHADLMPPDSPPAIRLAMTGSPWEFPLGFTMAFRSVLLAFSPLQSRSIDPYHDGEILAHDQWIAFLAWVFGSHVYLPDLLADYRIHDTNTFGLKTRPRSNLLRFLHLAIEDRSQIYGRLALAATANASILDHIKSQADASAYLRRRAADAVGAWTDLAELYRIRRRVYSTPQLFQRLSALGRLISAGAYGASTRWSFGTKSLIRDILLGCLGGPCITQMSFPLSDRDSSLRALASRQMRDGRSAISRDMAPAPHVRSLDPLSLCNPRRLEPSRPDIL